MSRTTSLVTSYLQAVIFGIVAVRCYMAWLRDKDSRSGHLAVATGAFGASSLLGAITTTFINAQKNEVAPRWEGIVSSILIYLAIYAFLLFLSDFIPYPRWVHALLVVITATGVVFSIIEKPALKLNFINTKNCPFEDIPGIKNPIAYKTYIIIVLTYLALAFGVLAVAFLIYAARTGGIARFRMLSIGFGFALLCGLIGLLPRILFGNPCNGTAKTILTAVTYGALVAAPLLLIGFAPPKFIRARFAEPTSVQS